MRTHRFHYDLAYSCYLFVGLVALFVSAIEAGLLSHDVAVALSYVIAALAIPLLIAVCGAILVAIVLSLRHWRHWPLPALGAASVLLIVLLMATEYGSTKLFYKSATVLYGAIVVAFAGAWFFSSRSKHATNMVE